MVSVPMVMAPACNCWRPNPKPRPKATAKHSWVNGQKARPLMYARPSVRSSASRSVRVRSVAQSDSRARSRSSRALRESPTKPKRSACCSRAACQRRIDRRVSRVSTKHTATTRTEMARPAAGTATDIAAMVPIASAMLLSMRKPDSAMALPTMLALPSTCSRISPTGRLSTSSTGCSTAAWRSSRTRRLSAMRQPAWTAR